MEIHRQKNKRKGEKNKRKGEKNVELLLREQIMWEKSIQYINETEKVRGRENWGMR